MHSPNPQRYTDLDTCVEALLSRVGKRIVLGLPVGIGKPNPLVNALVRRAVAEPSLRLTVVTALSLRRPRGSSDLERRFLEPLTQRVFGDYPELEYVRLLEQERLPANIEVIEFYLEPGAWLANDVMQQHYLSANYTHVLRDALARGLNVVAQLVAVAPPGEPGDGHLSLGSNPDMTADLLPRMAALRAAGRPVTLVGQVHRELPFMYGDALVPESDFDVLLDDAGARFPLYAPPNTPIGLTEHAIALNVSTLLRDGGTLQLGIGELGDAIAAAAALRHRDNGRYQAALAASGTLDRHRALIEATGGTAPFERGLYGCSEMLVDGFLDLYRSGVIRRRVYPHAVLQRLVDAGTVIERPARETLDELAALGQAGLSRQDVARLQAAGVLAEGLQLEQGELVRPDGARLAASLETAEQRAAIAAGCLGTGLRGGVLVDAGFFLGPRAFYAALRDMPPQERRQFAMRGIGFVNDLSGADQDLKIAQRRHARFVNTTMMMTGLGAAVSDGLADGRVVSGVGGQYNFVAMAHALPEARSILCLRSLRSARGVTTSNIVWSYGHATIPRHLRDIVVTEYGIADLRGLVDGEVVAALVGVMDARFQDAFVAEAIRAGKLPRGYRVPDTARGNRRERIEASLGPLRERGVLAELPFGSDLDAEEIRLARALRRIEAGTRTGAGRLAFTWQALRANPADPELAAPLGRLGLAHPRGVRQRIERRLVAAALRRT